MVCTSTAMVLTAATIITILFATNLPTIANAQQQPFNQTAAITNGTLYQSTMDNFRVQLPEGWVIQDVNNTGSALEAEVLHGYGILAQLCPEEQQQTAPDVGGNSSVGSTFSSICQDSKGNIIHIVRYPNLSATVGFTPDDFISDRNSTANAILAYQIQNLQEVGYRDIQIVNSTDTTMNVDITTAASDVIDNDNINALPPVKVPAKLVEMTYSTNLDPTETRTGYYLLTATAATSSNRGMITGYGVFYEGNSTGSAAETTIPSGSLAPTPLPAAASQVFDSFELIASEETVQAILAALTTQLEQAHQLGQAQQIVTTQTVQTGVVGEPITPLAGELNSNDTEGVAPATFEFDINLRGGVEPYSIDWDFGDGSQESDKETVVHTFDEAGIYAVTVTIIDSAGQAGSATMEITVKESSQSTPEEDEETTCDPSYPNVCIPSPPPNLTCDDEGVPENFEVLSQDPHGFDADNDGIGCESESNQNNTGSGDTGSGDTGSGDTGSGDTGS
ncbi:MAG TPA: PKD domain-containing protein, partial [Nitrososphaera sp.]